MSTPPVNRSVLGGQFETRHPRPASSPRRNPLPSGRDLLDRINSGEAPQAPTEYLESVRRRVSENCEELIEVGARIRPLMSGDKQVGWVRGVHPSERKWLKRWIKDPNEFVTNILLLGTSFDIDQINNMSAAELQSLMSVVKRMTEYDMSLWPYLSAFSCTQTSENLWFGNSTNVTSYENKEVTMPDGKTVKIAQPPDHARMWATLCTYREQAKKRLDENWNALLTIRPMAGRNADPLQSELKSIQRRLAVDSMDPWMQIVRADPKRDMGDGWGHPGDSVADLEREMLGMMRGDKHEKAMAAFDKSREKDEAKRVAALEAKRKSKGYTTPGVVEEKVFVYTEKEIREREAALKKGQLPKKKSPHFDRDAREVVQSGVDKLKRYR